MTTVTKTEPVLGALVTTALLVYRAKKLKLKERLKQTCEKTDTTNGTVKSREGIDFEKIEDVELQCKDPEQVDPILAAKVES